MAAVTLREGREFDCVTTFSVLANYLPVYARPRFIRIQVRRPIRAFLADFLLSVQLQHKSMSCRIPWK